MTKGFHLEATRHHEHVIGGLTTALDLSFNNLNDEGVSAVCEAIQSNKETKLASLNMCRNKLWSNGSKVSGGHGGRHTGLLTLYVPSEKK